MESTFLACNKKRAKKSRLSSSELTELEAACCCGGVSVVSVFTRFSLLGSRCSLKYYRSAPLLALLVCMRERVTPERAHTIARARTGGAREAEEKSCASFPCKILRKQQHRQRQRHWQQQGRDVMVLWKRAHTRTNTRANTRARTNTQDPENTPSPLRFLWSVPSMAAPTVATQNKCSCVLTRSRTRSSGGGGGYQETNNFRERAPPPPEDGKDFRARTLLP